MDNMDKRLQPLLAEAIGTFAFFVIGAGAVITDHYTKGGVGLVGIALAHGLVLSVMISMFGRISGGHFNPAVTIGVLIGKKIDAPLAGLYIVAQLIGAVCAGGVLRMAFDPSVWGPVHLGTPGLGAGISFGAGVFIEAVLTFFLVMAVYGTAVDPQAPNIAGFGIGLTVAFDILMGGPLTGASMNPARTFGPALASGYWDNHLVYWIGPIIGGAIAGLVYTNFFMSKPGK